MRAHRLTPPNEPVLPRWFAAIGLVSIALIIGAVITGGALLALGF